MFIIHLKALFVQSFLLTLKTILEKFIVINLSRESNPRTSSYEGADFPQIS